jgi:hypothetical protein
MTDLSDLIYDVEVNLQSSGLVKLQRGLFDGEPTGLRRWVFVDKAAVKRLMGESVLEADGATALAELNADAAIAQNPYLAFRNYMSPEALRIFNLKLVEARLLSQV